QWLHFATHGFFAPKEVKSALAPSKEPPKGLGERSLFEHVGVSGWHPDLLSGLVLAGANKPLDPAKDDGILTALEVSGLELDGVELAVVSACGARLGGGAGGAGRVGPQAAFPIAGARWAVERLRRGQDNATRDLLERFYSKLGDRKAPLSGVGALRQAQLWMLREGPTRGFVADHDKQAPAAARRAPPYWWAAFVLSG